MFLYINKIGFAKKLVLVFFSIVIVLIVGEVIARIIYVKPWYLRLIEEQGSYNLESKHRRNVFGLRDQDYSSLKSSNCKRVLVLGDSFTVRTSAPVRGADPAKGLFAARSATPGSKAGYCWGMAFARCSLAACKRFLASSV